MTYKEWYIKKGYKVPFTFFGFHRMYPDMKIIKSNSLWFIGDTFYYIKKAGRFSLLVFNNRKNQWERFTWDFIEYLIEKFGCIYKSY